MSSMEHISAERTEDGCFELPFYLTNPTALLWLEMFHALTRKEITAVSFDYRAAFDEGWRFEPTEKLDYAIPSTQIYDGYYLLIYCQVSGVPFGVLEKPFRVRSSDGSESLFVCKEVRDWLLKEKGWVSAE